MVAMFVEEVLQGAGYDLIGPLPRVADALHAAETEVMDAALLDVNVRGELIYPVVRVLRRRGVPVVLSSGYAGMGAIPEEFAQLDWLSKPYSEQALLGALALAVRR